MSLAGEWPRQHGRPALPLPRSADSHPQSPHHVGYTGKEPEEQFDFCIWVKIIPKYCRHLEDHRLKGKNKASDRTDLVNLISPCPGAAWLEEASYSLRILLDKAGPLCGWRFFLSTLVQVSGELPEPLSPPGGSHAQGRWHSKVKAGGRSGWAPGKISLARFWSLISDISHNASVLCLEVGSQPSQQSPVPGISVSLDGKGTL